MLNFVLRRLAQSLLVLLVVSLLSFLVFRYLGDPTVSLLGEDASQADRAALLAQLGYDQPVITQYLAHLGRLVQGEFGISYRLSRPVLELLLVRLPATLELALVAGGIALVGGLLLGVYTAVRRDGLLSRAIMTLSLLGVSLPTFLIGIGLIWLFTVQFHWLPAFGRGPTVNLGGWHTGLLSAAGWAAITMPALTLGLYKMTLIMRLVRAEILVVLRSDYIRFARSRGLGELRLLLGHALPNTLIPVITITALQLGSLIAFAVVTETVFQWPGVGLLFISSVQGVDVPVMSAFLLLVALVFVTVNLLADLACVLADPRLRHA